MCILLTCPAQVHFCLLTCSITSLTRAFSLYRYIRFSVSVLDVSPTSLYPCMRGCYNIIWLVLCVAGECLCMHAVCQFCSMWLTHFPCNRCVTFYILLSILACAAASSFFAWLVSVYVCAPYVSFVRYG